MYDIFYIRKPNSNSSDFDKLKSKYPFIQAIDATDDYFDAYKTAQKKSMTKFFWIFDYDVKLNDDCNFSYVVPVWDRFYIHIFKYRVYLIPKHYEFTDEEITHNYFQHHKIVDHPISKLIPYDFFEIDSYEEYLSAMKKTTTNMFWMGSKHIQLSDSFESTIHSLNLDNKRVNYSFKHKNKDKETYDGLFLCSKEKQLTPDEVKYRTIKETKTYDVVASIPKLYDRFEVDSYEDYLNALATVKTRMFWITSRHLEIEKDFDFDICFSHTRNNDVGYKKKTNAFINIVNGTPCYDGVFLCSKSVPLSREEIETRNLDPNKLVKWKTIASKKKPYDIVFISYDEEAAEKNYLNLKERFPHIKHVHGVKGIHNAHIAAANLVDTKMFWVIDADAVILDSFNFDYTAPAHDEDIVHVWQSQNLVNNLTYGYGGVKLLPKNLTIEMDTNTVDMTTNISKRFRVMPEVSNVTKFNTDPFNSWKSAFRECAKLASVLEPTKETLDRLDTWCSIKNDVPFANEAVLGAISGRDFGSTYKDSTDMILKINDWDWLKTHFNKST